MNQFQKQIKTRGIFRIPARFIIIVMLAGLSFFSVSCETLLSILGTATPPTPAGTTVMTERQVAAGLKEALKVGINNSVSLTNRTDGFFGNSMIKIPWPSEAQGAYNFINQNASLSFLRPVLDEVVLKMNRGAEQASARATPIFVSAIEQMTIIDAWNILRGANNAATLYLQSKTYNNLHTAFMPDIQNALESVGAASAWQTVTTGYNTVANNPILGSGLNPINTDLADYTTRKALDGLFLLVAQEELKIRSNPAARVNDILKEVFGQLDR